MQYFYIDKNAANARADRGKGAWGAEAPPSRFS